MALGRWPQPRREPADASVASRGGSCDEGGHAIVAKTPYMNDRLHVDLFLNCDPTLEIAARKRSQTKPRALSTVWRFKSLEGGGCF